MVKRKRGKGKVGDFFKKAYSYVKDNKLISRGLNSLGSALPAQYGAIASKAGQVADTLGFGRRGKRGGCMMPRRGRGLVRSTIAM